jgi:alpha-beta hydrolase superfamily lysophospholipase
MTAWLRSFRNRLPPKSGLYATRRWYHPLALLRRLVNYYLMICIALSLLQNHLLFPRWITGSVLSAEQAQANAAAVGLVPWNQPTSKTAFIQGYVRSNFAQAAPRGTIVVFHGNAGCAFDRSYYSDAFAQRGFRTFLYEYPGYGGRAGSPSASSIIGDAQALVRSLDRAGYGPIYLWGESVGSGIAAEVCRDPTLPVHGLVLLTPWDSLAHAAATHYPFIPVSVLLWDKYDSVANLENFHHPVCVICSTDDTILPARLGLNLYARLNPPKNLILQPDCGHNDWPNSPALAWWDNALDFIAPRDHLSIDPVTADAPSP